ncbi:16649_t:CDS:2, partial [Dentiscutata heterogama]
AAKDLILLAEDTIRLFDKINKKILSICQKEEYDQLSKSIITKQDSAKLDNWKNIVDLAKYLILQQKDKLYKLRIDHKWQLHSAKASKQFKHDIETESFIGNLLNSDLYETLVKADSFLTDTQKDQLYTICREQISRLTNKIYDNLKNSIRNDHVTSRLEDKDQNDVQIQDIRENFLTNRTNWIQELENPVDKPKRPNAESNDELFLTRMPDNTNERRN